MKKYSSILVLVISLVSLSPVSGQMLTKGSVIGSGAFEFSSGKEEQESGGSTFETDLVSVGFNPWAGYFITPSLGVGAGAQFGFSSSKNDSFEQKTTTVVFGPVVRYYILEGPFVQGFFGFGSSKSKSKSGGIDLPESKDKITTWELAGGYSIRLSDTVLLDPMLGYGSVKAVDDEDSDFSTTTSGLFIRVGFTIVLVSK